jgi:transcriptional regulator with GAF, ATPase, and Fis domain
VTLNCAPIPSGLLESGFFGRERGAYAGALNSALGRFPLAPQGTLFLDESGDMPLELQPKLLSANARTTSRFWRGTLCASSPTA